MSTMFPVNRMTNRKPQKYHFPCPQYATKSINNLCLAISMCNKLPISMCVNFRMTPIFNN